MIFLLRFSLILPSIQGSDEKNYSIIEKKVENLP